MSLVPLRTLAVSGLALFLAALALPVQAAYLERFAPQGEVKEARRFSALFSAPMVRLGDNQGQLPFDIRCPVPGSSQWSDQRTWTYVLSRPLAAGERCDFRPRSGLQALNGERVSASGRYAVFAPGPWLREIAPAQGNSIEEDQVFLLAPAQAIRADSLAKSAWCEADGVGERIPVSVLDKAEAERIRKALSLSTELSGNPHLLAVRCVQRLPAGAKARLVWGKGIEGEGGARTLQDLVYEFQVRPPFRATLSCEREKAGQPCSPLSDLRLEFSDRLPRKLAEQIRLETPQGSRSPSGLPVDEGSVDLVKFRGPFPPQVKLQLQLPKGLADDSGRALENAGSFPLAVPTGALPPLAKFPGRFGILELKEGGVLPVTLRQVEAQLPMGVAGVNGQARQQRLDEDAQVIATWKALEEFEAQGRSGTGPDGEETYDPYYARELSFLTGKPGVEQRSLPKPGGTAEFEVVGIPLEKPGFYVVELESRLLGASLLATPKPMYVRTAALVTNLSVHFKRGRENALVWVTSLDQGKPVAGARVRISNCKGKAIWSGETDAQGRALVPQDLRPASCDGDEFFFVSARQGDDFSFVRSDWSEGIEPWRFGVNGWSGLEPRRIHAILDRTMLRAGETLSAKLVAREVGMGGFGFPKAADLPARLTARFLGGEEEWNLPLKWDARGNATLAWPIPASARVGTYQLSIEGGGYGGQELGSIRVSEFRLPVFTGALEAAGGRQVGVAEVPLQMRLNFLNGGAAAGHPVQVSGTLQPLYLDFPGYGDYRFDLPRDFLPEGSAGEGERLIADKVPVTLDKQGSGKLAVKLPGQARVPERFYGEMTFADPNGAIQTIGGQAEIWPAGVVAGIKVEDWVSVKEKGRVQVVVLDTRGQPAADAQVLVQGRRKVEYSHRKRIVGGFYAYEQSTELDDLGRLCEGRSDSRGRFSCEIRVDKPGNIQLTVEARDKQGRGSQSGTSYWVSGDGDVWFAQENQDRMDLLPEKLFYQPGETARFQVRTPFRDATVLVSVEREGVVETQVRELSRFDPVVEVPIRSEWAPNVYVSVLAVRGRVREVSWYSFFQWGWKAPMEWFQAWWNPPGATALVDLARPAFKLGLAEIQVGRSGHELKVEVQADKAEYQTRDTAQVKIRVLQPDGKPAPAGSEVAVAAVDQALLELSPNGSWDLLDAMIQPRGYGVETATSQMQVVGKRHYGKKALPAGGGGGRGATRELFDTLLLWNPRVVLDQQGSATVAVPLSDALTQFAIVAVAESGAGLFGTGRTRIVTRQDLQIISGLPPLVREQDRYQALVTLRNASARPMQVQVAGQLGDKTPGRELPAHALDIPAGESREVGWDVSVPDAATQQVWEIEARESSPPAGGRAARDRLKVVQQVVPAVPLTVQQASFVQVEGSVALNVVAPPNSLPGRGGLEVSLMPRLSTPPAGLLRFFEEYPYTCLEQKTSRAIGLGQPALWRQVGEQLPAYLDSQGFARYFPGNGAGSDVLTAYLLSVARAAGLEWPEAAARRMEEALAGFVEGRFKPESWSPRDDLLERKLAALEALSRLGKASGRQLGSLEVVPARLDDGSLVDWLAILKRVSDAPRRKERLAEATQELRNRLRDVGGQLEFAPRSEGVSWWRMSSDSGNLLRLMETVLDDEAWRDDLPRLMRAALARQKQGHWGTTVANVWGRLALAGFGQRFETAPVSGVTRANLDGRAVGQVDWQASPQGGRFLVPWSTRQASARPDAQAAGGAVAIAASDVLRLSQEGSGSPWAAVSALAAVPVLKAESRGFAVTRTVTPVEQKQAGVYSRGDVLRVRLEVEAEQPMSWVVVNDPVPAGATVLGDGSGRDSRLATRDEKTAGAWPAFEERTLSFYRAYYAQVPKGRFVTEYTLRLNSAGEFSMPATRVEAMYGPEWFGVLPNGSLKVHGSR